MKNTVTDATAYPNVAYIVLPKPGTARVAHIRLDGVHLSKKRRSVTRAALCGQLANTHYGETYKAEPAETGRTLVPFLEAFPLPHVGYDGYSPHGVEGLRVCPKCLGILITHLDLTDGALALITGLLESRGRG